MRIQVITDQLQYQGLYKGTVIDNAYYDDDNGAFFSHNGKRWSLMATQVKVLDTEKTQDVCIPVKPIKVEKESALDRQVSGSHYKDFKIQPAEYCHANNIPFLEGNVIKYVSRHKMKNKKKDLEKAIHCLELLIELEYPDD